MAESAAVSQLAGLQARVSQLEEALVRQQEQASRLTCELDTQHAVNRQLMSKKEEVEWQLMAALAKVGAPLPAACQGMLPSVSLLPACLALSFSALPWPSAHKQMRHSHSCMVRHVD